MSAPEARFRDGVFVFPVRVYYEDTDFSGFVYHANYLRFFERGRSEALRATGVSHRELLSWEPPAAMVVRRMEIDFIRPALIEDELIVESRFTLARGARMGMSQLIRRGREEIVRADVEAALVTLDGRPRKIPRPVMAQLRPYLASPAP